MYFFQYEKNIFLFIPFARGRKTTYRLGKLMRDYTRESLIRQIRTRHSTVSWRTFVLARWCHALDTVIDPD